MTDKIRLIEKPWGMEEILEKNEKYMLKRLTMKKGYRCSIQYHNIKKETIYVLSGSLMVELNESIDGGYISTMKKIMLGPGEFLTIEPKMVHRMSAVNEDCVYLESSTPDEEDVVRIKDDYGRK